MVRLDRKIRLYYMDTEQTESGCIRVKKYLNKDENTMINAYFRTLASTEMQTDNQLGFVTTAQIEINRRAIQEGYFIELTRSLYGTETYRVEYYDPFADRQKVRYRIRCRLVKAEPYDEVRYGQ